MKWNWKKEISKILPFSGSEASLLRRAAAYIKPYKLKFFFAFLCVLSGIGFGLIQPLYFGKSITHIIEKDIRGLWFVVMIMACAFMAQQGVTVLQAYLFSFLNQNIVFDLKRDMYDVILGLPMRTFDNMKRGEFMSRLEGDSNAVSALITHHLLNSLVNLLRVIVVGIALLKINPFLFTIVLVTLPCSYVLFIVFGKKLKAVNKKLAAIRDSCFSNAQETLSGMREIKGLGIIEIKNAEFLAFLAQFKASSIILGIFNGMMELCSNGITFLSEISVLLAGFYLILQGRMSLELLIAFTSYGMQFRNSLMSLTGLNASLQQALVSFRRIFALSDGLKFPKVNSGNEKRESISGEIKFCGISFAYEKDQPVLRDINFHIRPGSKVAFVGPSGGGKTTIFNLLLRFYEPEKGCITLDGLPLAGFPEQSLRKNLSVIHQEPFLFNGSIMDNLRYANPAAGTKEIIQACQTAFIHDYIESLPEKYKTPVGEQGVNFSVGQKQRLAIARSLVKEAPVILFDEATSSLDNESQYMIKKAIEKINKEKTILMIAHRLFTVIDADIIYVIDQGMIAGKGIHAELMRDNRIYRRLYKEEVDSISRGNRIAAVG